MQLTLIWADVAASFGLLVQLPSFFGGFGLRVAIAFPFLRIQVSVNKRKYSSDFSQEIGKTRDREIK